MPQVSRRPFIMMGGGAESWGTWGRSDGDGDGGSSGDLNPADMVGSKVWPTVASPGPTVTCVFTLLSVVEQSLGDALTWEQEITVSGMFSKTADQDPMFMVFGWTHMLKPYGGLGLQLLTPIESLPTSTAGAVFENQGVGNDLQLRAYKVTSLRRSSSTPILYVTSGNAYELRFIGGTGGAAAAGGTFKRTFVTTR